MLNPIRLVNDLFDDQKLFDKDLQPFCEDHLIRMANNNPGAIYSSRITDTSNKLMAFSGARVSEMTKIAVREGLSQAMMEKRTLMLEQVSSIGRLVDYKYVNDQEKYQQFFPQGVDEYYQADLGELNPLLDRLQTAATTHLTANHPIDVTALTNAITDFKTARTSQLNAFSEEETLASDRRIERKNLTLQLTSNFLILANDHLEQPDLFDNYYNPELLPLTEGNDGDGGGTAYQEFTIAPAQLLTIGEAPESDDVVLEIIHASGNGNAQFCTAPTEDSPCVGNTYSLVPGATFNDEYGTMNISGGQFVRVANTGTDNLVIRLRVIV